MLNKNIEAEIKLLNEGEAERYVQSLIDSIVAIQKGWPMPTEGWEDFKADIEYTNEKRGWNLRINKDE